MGKSEDSVFVAKSMKGYLARTALMDAAIGMIADHGLKGFPVGRLCDAAGLNRTSFYSYFDTLEDLFDELSDRETRAFGRKFRSEFGYVEPGAQRFFVNMIGFFRIAAEDATWNRFVINLVAEHQKTRERDARAVEKDILAAVENGDMKLDPVQIEVLKNLLFTTMTHVRYDAFKNAPQIYVEQICELFFKYSSASRKTRTRANSLIETWFSADFDPAEMFARAIDGAS